MNNEFHRVRSKTAGGAECLPSDVCVAVRLKRIAVSLLRPNAVSVLTFVTILCNSVIVAQKHQTHKDDTIAESRKQE